MSAAPFQAGLLRFTVQDVQPFDMLVWYPTLAPGTPNRIGPFPIEATPGALLADGARLPAVVLSHGSGGSPMMHRELAQALAQEGFVVIAPTQIGDSAGHTEGRAAGRALIDRPRQAELALDAALSDPRLAARIDPDRIGVVGFSAGGYTALALGDRVPDFALAQAYCTAHPQDRGSCGDGPQPARRDPPPWRPVADARVKALVLMDPLAIVFDRKALARVHVPVLLIRPADDSYLAAGPNALAVAQGLGSPPEQIVVPGAHFVLLDPCPEKLRDQAPEICKDAPEVDRPAIHRELEQRIAAFLHYTL